MIAQVVALALLSQSATGAPGQSDGGVVASESLLTPVHVSSCTSVGGDTKPAGCWYSIDDCIERARRNYAMRSELEQCKAKLNPSDLPILIPQPQSKGWSGWAVVAAFLVGIGAGVYVAEKVGK